jgi:hypothetical protein
MEVTGVLENNVPRSAYFSRWRLDPARNKFNCSTVQVFILLVLESKP